jgi:pyruvate/2-oxoglutarate/acetoin dehydrogenase E1 component
MHVPGLKVVAPTTPYDAKGALIASIRDDDPVIFVEHRMIHSLRGHVPEEPYALPIGRSRVLLEGTELTIVGISHFALEALRAAHMLRDVGISAEVLDPIWLQPLDLEGIVASVRKTGRLLVVDTAWTSCGATAEILARVVEALQREVDLRVARMGFAPVTCPTVRCLENEFYPSAQSIAARGFEMVRGEAAWSLPFQESQEIIEFKGPF